MNVTKCHIKMSQMTKGAKGVYKLPLAGEAPPNTLVCRGPPASRNIRTVRNQLTRKDAR